MKSALWVILLYLLCLLPLFWTEWSGYANQKVLRMFTLTFLSSIAPIFLFKKKQDLYAFFSCVVFLFMIIGARALINWNLGVLYSHRLQSFTQEIALSRSAAIASLWFLVLFISRDKRKKLVFLFLSSLFLVIMVGSGARVPLLAFIISVLSILVIYSIKTGNKLKLLFIMIFIFFSLYFALKIAPLGSKERLSNFISGKIDWESNTRLEYYKIAIISTVNNPFGVGWGGFEKVATGSFQPWVNRYYPHNLYLEAFVEGGWALGLFLLIFVGYSIYGAWKKCNYNYSQVWMFLLAYLLFLVISVGFSNDWNDSRDLFALLTISLISSHINKPKLK